MKKSVATAALVLAVIAAYLLAWPVPVEPVSWQAPTDRGLVDPFDSNDLLGSAVGIDLDGYEGPEDATVGADGLIYATTHSGHVIQIEDSKVREFAFPGGRPLGIETDVDGSLIIANAYVGLQRVGHNGTVSTLLREVDGRPLVYANNAAIGPDGTIYFSEASSKFGAQSSSGTYQASLLDIMEHGGHGRVFAFRPSTGDVDILLENLNFANGVAVNAGGSFLLVSETGHYRVLKYWLTGDRKGTTEVLLDNLPGFPDNLDNGAQGRFWLGLAAPRNHLLDKISDRPFVRKIVQRLPAFLRPSAVPSSHVIAFNGDGEILMNLHDADARFPTLTGVLETHDALYLTTLFGRQLPRLAKQEL
ncbi:MAG: SMP-30/gluconolactonase/LRE family protein [Gammaproteobacteria bacterium]|nr:SMP-30/gluconolactonase/LRE family protein [Gammaproteobacteria bacterium]MBT8110843.1 SMP-30/gluconolactonase/LRE family protein [Gammaproteobacteria bacterium]NNL45542.1 strictosidine synthase family protein [Woeseiaceae bacterium]